MNPGRELDALIAEKVMRLDLLEEDAHENWIPIAPEPYSTDIAAAWKVLTTVPCHGWTLHSEWAQEPHCTFYNWDSENTHKGQSIPHAICLAALIMMEKK